MTVATPAMLQRASSPITGRVYRVFVGPQERFIDYALYAAGEPVSLPAEATVAVTVGWGTGAPIDIEVDDATGFSNGPSMFFISSPISGMAWVRYESRDSNTFIGCTRVWGQSGGIAAGSKITQWAEITAQIVGNPTVSRDWTDTVSDWSWQIAGYGYNSDLMAPDATVLIVESVTPNNPPNQWTNQWSDFVIAGLGYVRRWESTGDAARQRRWSARVESIRTYVDSYQIQGKTFGRVNLAAGQPVTASPNLANPLVLMELDEPEWKGVIGTTDADKLTDSEIDTGPYVSQVQPSQTPETPGSSGASPVPLIEQVYFGEDGLQFIELRLPADSPNYNEEGISLSNYALTNLLTVFVESFGVYPDNHPDHPGDRWPKEIRQGAHNYIRLKDITLSENNDRVILTNNRNAFARRWNISGNVQVYDWRELPGFGDDGLSGAGVVFDRLGDWLQMRYCGQGLQTVQDMVVWGSPIGSTPWWNSATDAYESDAQWPDNSDRAPLVDEGNSIRRFPVSTDTNGEDDWIEVEAIDVNPAERRTDTDPVYMSIEFADIPTALSEDITASSHDTSDTLPLIAPEYLYMPQGQTSIRIRLNSEEMILKPNVARTGWQIVGRGYNGTTPADHTAETPVYYYYDGGFIRNPWVHAFELRRWVRFDTNAIGTEPYIPRVPRVWQIWGTREESPRYLGEADYRLDWIGGRQLKEIDTGEEILPFVQKGLIDPVPLKHGMIVGKRMRKDNTYWMVNEIRAFRPTLIGAVTGYEGIGNVVMYYLAQFPGLNRVIVDDDVFDGTSGDVTIVDGSLGGMLNDLAESYGFVVQYTRDNKVWIRRNPFHPRHTRPEIFAPIGPNMIAGTLSPQRASYPSRVGAGQVEVMIHDVDELRVFRGVYPPTSRFGDIRTIELTRSGDIETANEIAQAEYLANPDISPEIEFEIAGIFPELDPMQRVLVFNTTDDAAPVMNWQGIPIKGTWEDCLIKSVQGGGATGERVLCQVWRQA